MGLGRSRYWSLFLASALTLRAILLDLPLGYLLGAELVIGGGFFSSALLHRRQASAGDDGGGQYTRELRSCASTAFAPRCIREQVTAIFGAVGSDGRPLNRGSESPTAGKYS